MVGQEKTDRVVRLAERTNVSVSLDNFTAARALSKAASDAGVTVGVLVEIDAGLHRVGVTTGEALRQLALEVAELPGLRFDGIAFYPGHIKRMDPVATVSLTSVERRLREASRPSSEQACRHKSSAEGLRPRFSTRIWLPR